MLIDELKACSRCGKCRSVCPVFGELNDEVMSPRGRISLIEALLEGDISDSERYSDTILTCLKCSRCSSVCPVGIRIENMTQEARYLLAEKRGIPQTARKVFRDLLLDPPTFRSALVEAAASPSESEVPLWLLPLFFLDNVRLPKLADETALDKYPEYIDSDGDKKVALFLGCSMNYVSTDIVDSAIQALKMLGVSVFLPKDQVCCGSPALLYGDREAVAELAKRNLNALKADDFDAVITLCPYCGITLKRDYRDILGDDAEDFSSKVYDISEYIDKFTDYESHQTDLNVTYHEPCYLRFGQGVSDEPRRILEKSAGFIEMEDADKCCGLGGTMGIFHPELSVQMVKPKVEIIKKSEAEVVATGCPGCILFFREQLARDGVGKDVLHTIQILHKSLESG